jgi:beta-lactam-binding protein with PASTA domain
METPPTRTTASPTSVVAVEPTAAAPAATAAPPVKVPSLVGLTEAQARQVIAAAGLRNTYANYQGPGDVPPAALAGVPVGTVLSQIPAPGTVVAAGSTVYLAVRKN